MQPANENVEGGYVFRVPTGTIEQQALDWFIHSKSGIGTPDEMARLRDWLSADPEHEREFAEWEHVWDVAGEALKWRRQKDNVRRRLALITATANLAALYVVADVELFAGWPQTVFLGVLAATSPIAGFVQ